MTTQDYDTPAFNQTYQFCRFINANPASSLATQFVNAIAAAQSQDSAEAAADEIDGFFRKTGSYPAVTVDSFLDMSAWLFSKLPAWAGFAGHYTYHLKVAGENGAEDAGKVIFNQTQDADYSVTYLAPDGSKTPLYYQAAQLVDDLTADNPAVRLQTSFAALGLFTGEPADVETPVPVLCGTVHGQQSLALPEENDGNGQNQGNSFTVPEIAVLVVLGVGCFVGFVYLIYKGGVALWNIRVQRQLREQEQRLADSGFSDFQREEIAEQLEADLEALGRRMNEGRQESEGEVERALNESIKEVEPVLQNELPKVEVNNQPKEPEEIPKEVKTRLVKNIVDQKFTTEFKDKLELERQVGDWMKKPNKSRLKDKLDHAIDEIDPNKDNLDAFARVNAALLVHEELSEMEKSYKHLSEQNPDYDLTEIIRDTQYYKLRMDIKSFKPYDAESANSLLTKASEAIKSIKRDVQAMKTAQKLNKKLIAVEKNTEELTQRKIPENIEAITQTQQEYQTKTVQLENQQLKEALTKQLQTQQAQENDMAEKLGTNESLAECANQTAKNIENLKNIDISDKDAAAKLAAIADNANQTQAQLVAIANKNVQALQGQQEELNIQNSASQEDEQESEKAEEYTQDVQQIDA